MVSMMTRFFYSKTSRYTLLLLSIGIFYQTSVFSDNHSSCDTSDCVNTNRFTLRHIESKGIGYNQGYTTFEAFFTPLTSLHGRWIPFFDGRAHIFNNSKPAANIGVGLRYLNSRLWGTNIYYDFRKTSKLNYNQVSCGLETIGEKIDARINGYFPVGKHTSTRGSTTFDYFQGHHMYLVKKEEFALQGVNAELGIHLGRSKKIGFYTAFGPYYFCNNSKQAVGGSFRISMDFKDVFTLETSTSYDSLYKWIGQGQVSLSYPFKPKSFNQMRGKKSKTSCFDIRSRILQKVDKFEIIVTDTKKHKSLAINPATGQPYFFLFFDPTTPTNGTGTFETPLNSLQAIEGLSTLNEKLFVITPSHEQPALVIYPLPQKTSPSSLATQDETDPLQQSSSLNTQVSLPPPPEFKPIVVTPPSSPIEVDTHTVMPKIESFSIQPIKISEETPLSTIMPPQQDNIVLVPGKGQELQTTLGTVMIPASQKGQPKITHVKDIEYQGKKTHVFVITMEEETSSK